MSHSNQPKWQLAHNRHYRHAPRLRHFQIQDSFIPLLPRTHLRPKNGETDQTQIPRETYFGCRANLHYCHLAWRRSLFCLIAARPNTMNIQIYTPVRCRCSDGDGVCVPSVGVPRTIRTECVKHLLFKQNDRMVSRLKLWNRKSYMNGADVRYRTFHWTFPKVLRQLDYIDFVRVWRTIPHLLNLGKQHLYPQINIYI